jgi:hypothetical protein
MIKCGIEIKKMILRGIGKESAILTFSAGLNVVAGASDTGKSFAYECINYALGATNVPEMPNEAVGYDTVLLEFVEKISAQTITLKRSLKEPEKTNIYYAFSDIDHIIDANFETLSFDSKAKNSLSSKLLNLCNCTYENVLKSTSQGNTEAFTFRKFVYLTMLSEERIVQRNSPIFLGSTHRDANSPKEISTFFTVLSGSDYKKYVKIESAEIKKAQLKGRIEELSLMCNELRLEVVDLEKSIDESKVANVKEKIAELGIVIEQHKAIVEQEEEKHKYWVVQLRAITSEKSRIADNLSKFRLLKKNYESDIERLDFIEQSHNFTDQLVSVKCPICNSLMEKEISNHPKEIYFVAIDKEKQKLMVHLSDLEDTILDFENDLSECTNEISDKQTSIQGIEDFLQAQSLSISKTLSDYESYLKIRDKFVEIQGGRKKLFDMNSRISELSDRIDNTKSNANKVEIKKLSDELMSEFCNIVRVFLENWDFIDKDEVLFDKKSSDVIVSNKLKASYGKGARAIINSAFILSIMKFCIERGLPHPGFVILDSPLTTYKEKDKRQKAKNEEVNKSVKDSFFYDLASISNEYQIIVFDNEVPPNDLKNITYHHFTGNIEIERTGFIPN